MASPPQFTITSSLASAKASEERKSIGAPAKASPANWVNCRREISPRSILAESESSACRLVSLVMSVPFFLVVVFLFEPVILPRAEEGSLFPPAR